MEDAVKWSKLLALVMVKLGASEVIISEDDINRFIETHGPHPGLLANGSSGRLVITLSQTPGRTH